VVSEQQAKADDKGPDEATRITRIVLVAVILVLVGGLALLLVFGSGDDNSAREAVDELGRTQVSIRDGEQSATTDTSEPVSTDTASPAETEPPDTQGGEAVVDPGPAPNSPPAPPGQPATTVVPAKLEIFFGVDSQGRLPVKVGQGTQISIRNTGGAEGAWALNATGALRVDGVSGKNGRVPGGQVTIVTVTVDAATAPSVPTEASIRFDTPDGQSRTIPVQISP
jgi:hypothetical protein